MDRNLVRLKPDASAAASTSATGAAQADIAAAAEHVARGRERILNEIRKVIVGQDDVIDEVLMALFTGGHCLITGVPGLAKTLLIKTVAQILDLSFKRIQFTPDLMPADITGTEDRKSTRLNSSHANISYAVFCLKKKKQ